jgi:hypothetical protein
MIRNTGGARRLPQHVVLGQARAAPAHQFRGALADSGVQRYGGNAVVTFPGIHDFSEGFRLGNALAPVPLVGIATSVEVALE